MNYRLYTLLKYYAELVDKNQFYITFTDVSARIRMTTQPSFLPYNLHSYTSLFLRNFHSYTLGFYFILY